MMFSAIIGPANKRKKLKRFRCSFPINNWRFCRVIKPQEDDERLV